MCPFTGCGRSIDSDKFACSVHWRTLTGPQKAEIRAAFADYLAELIGLTTLRDRQRAVIDAAEDHNLFDSPDGAA